MSAPSSTLDAFALQPLVIDNGSGLLKAGFAGAETPSVIFPAYVGRPKHQRAMPGAIEGDWFVGDAARDLKGLLKLTYPQRRGICPLSSDWDDEIQIWHHTYRQVHVTTTDQHPVLMTEPALNARSHRTRAAEVFFETFNVPAFQVQPAALLALYASGKTTGIVLDCGEGVSSVVPVVEGFVVTNGIQRIDIGGRDVTVHLQLLLRKAGYHLNTSAELEIVKDIKEKICYVAYAVDNANKGEIDDVEPEVPYKLPDGTVLNVAAEKFRAPELLFQPMTIGSEEPGVHQMLHTSISRCDLDLRRVLYSSICLSGGSTLFDGFGDRLLAELRRAAPRDTKIKIWAPPERLLSPWIGGSILASLASFKHTWISRRAWDEHGARLLRYPGS